MFLRAIILSTLFAFSMYAQEEHRFVQLIPRDSIRLTDSLDMFTRFQPPKIYNEWFKRIVECENLTMPPEDEVESLKFYVMNNQSFSMAPLNVQYDGLTFSKEHIIILSYPFVNDYRVVAHEFLHFALWYNFGSKYMEKNVHPLEYFSKCDIRSF